MKSRIIKAIVGLLVLATLGATFSSAIRRSVLYMLPSDYLNVDLSFEGSHDMAVDGSLTPVVFSYPVPEGECAVIGRLMLYMSSSTNFSEDKFAHLDELPYGLRIEVNGTELTNWTNNVHISHTMYDFGSGGDIFGKAAQSAKGRWTFSKAHAKAGGLLVTEGQEFKATVRDDLSDLDHLHLTIQGQRFDWSP